MVDFEFYGNTYQGTRIPEKAWPGYAQQAQYYLDRLCRLCRVEGGDDAKAMALCAMADVLHREKGRENVVSSTAGEVSVRYGGRTLLGQLYEQAGIYLDIYRRKGA